MATVYVGVGIGPAKIRRLCAIKVMHSGGAEDASLRERFLKEARLASRLDHPNIVSTFDVGHFDDRDSIVMELIEGISLHELRKRLQSEPSLPFSAHLHILMKVLAGVHHAHEVRDYDGSSMNIVHRDVNPTNVFVSFDGQVKLIDFGLAMKTASSIVPRARRVEGKLGYMAPEQAAGRYVDRRADVYSVGVMLWEAIAGRSLYEGKAGSDILNQLASGEPVPPPNGMREGPAALANEITLKALAFDPEDRFETAGEFLTALEELAEACDARCTSRTLSDIVSHNFSRERARLRERIAKVTGELTKDTSASSAEDATRSTPPLSSNETALTDHRCSSDAPVTSPSVARSSRSASAPPSPARSARFARPIAWAFVTAISLWGLAMTMHVRGGASEVGAARVGMQEQVALGVAPSEAPPSRASDDAPAVRAAFVPAPSASTRPLAQSRGDASVTTRAASSVAGQARKASNAALPALGAASAIASSEAPSVAPEIVPVRAGVTLGNDDEDFLISSPLDRDDPWHKSGASSSP